MISLRTTVAACSIAITTALAYAAGVDDSELGLSKTSVFNTPAPESFSYDDTKARFSEAMPRAFPGAPPQVPHEIESMLPITLDDNQCLECHDRPEMIGEEVVKGGKPMDQNHYGEVGVAHSEDGWRLSGARFNCHQCHVPQTGALPLVSNSFE